MARLPAERPFWTNCRDILLVTLGAGLKGLDGRTASLRLLEFGPNRDEPAAKAGALKAIARRLLEPLCLMLLLAGLVVVWTGNTIGVSIIVAILGPVDRARHLAGGPRHQGCRTAARAGSVGFVDQAGHGLTVHHAGFVDDQNRLLGEGHEIPGRRFGAGTRLTLLGTIPSSMTQIRVRSDSESPFHWSRASQAAHQ